MGEWLTVIYLDLWGKKYIYYAINFDSEFASVFKMFLNEVSYAHQGCI